MGIERRETRRVVVGPEHTVRFQVKGVTYQDVRITNLSLGGCFATVPGTDARLFTQGTILEQFGFEHPDLPHDRFTARIAFVLGGDISQPCMDFMGLGIQFISLPPALLEPMETLMSRLMALSVS